MSYNAARSRRLDRQRRRSRWRCSFASASTGHFTNVPAGFVADATTGPSLATLVTPVSVVLPAAAEDQPLAQVRVITANAAGNDEWVGIDDIAVTGRRRSAAAPAVIPTSASPRATPASRPRTSGQADPAGRRRRRHVDVATADGTALIANTDYVPLALDRPAIAEGGEPRSTSASSATPSSSRTSVLHHRQQRRRRAVADDAGIGTIINDDVAAHRRSTTSRAPARRRRWSGSVSTRGIVTGAQDQRLLPADAGRRRRRRPATSEGIVRVHRRDAAGGRRRRRAACRSPAPWPSSCPAPIRLQPPLTELGGRRRSSRSSTGHPLPAPMAITAARPQPGVRRLEPARAPRGHARRRRLADRARADAGHHQRAATPPSTSSGVFYGVVTGVPRPFREPGIQVPDPLPARRAVPPIPRFDANPERLRVDSDASPAPRLDVAARRRRSPASSASARLRASAPTRSCPTPARRRWRARRHVAGAVRGRDGDGVHRRVASTSSASSTPSTTRASASRC